MRILYTAQLNSAKDVAKIVMQVDFVENATTKIRVPVRVSHVAIGESSKELAKPNLWILAILAKSINSSN